MQQAKSRYIKPEIITLGSSEIVRLVGPAQGYGISGGNSGDFSESLLGSPGGTSEVGQR